MDSTLNGTQKDEAVLKVRPDDFLEIDGQQFKVRPLNPAAFIAFAKDIKPFTTALNAIVKESATASDDNMTRVGLLVSGLANVAIDNADVAVSLVYNVLRRASKDIDREFIMEKMDLVDGFSRFFEIFIRQNSLDALAKKVQGLQGLLEAPKTTPLASSSSATSSAGTTDGQPTS